MTGRGVLVIGATSEIGLAISRSFAIDGDRVVGVALESVVDPAFVEFIVADCSDSGAASGVVDAAFPAARPPRRCCARSGGYAGSLGTRDIRCPVACRSRATLESAFYVIRAALRHLPAGSAIVAVTSVNAQLAAPGVPAYAAAKAGVEGLVRQLALEYGPLGIRVNSVAPGMVGSDSLPKVTEGYPLGRTGRPDDVAAAVTFLASSRADFITGVTLPVDGGLSISSPAAWLRPDLRARWL